MIQNVLDMIVDEKTPEKQQRPPPPRSSSSFSEETTALVPYEKPKESAQTIPLQVPQVYSLQWCLVPLTGLGAVFRVSSAPTSPAPTAALSDVAQILRNALEAEHHDPASASIKRTVTTVRDLAKQEKEEAKAEAKHTKEAAKQAKAKLASKKKKHAPKAKSKVRQAAISGKGGAAQPTSPHAITAALG